MNRICLVAIFRNEARNVFRCLSAAKGTIDYISIVDTGSTDDTAALIRQWSELNSIPVAIHAEPFINFGINRSQSVDLARSAFPDATHFLLLDADMVLQGSADLRREDLSAPSYLLKQVNPGMEYWNIRILKSDLRWTCHGVTHEYWQSEPTSRAEPFEGLWIEDRGDGGHKADKFQRDLALLNEALADSQTDEALRTRYTFYLAQTLRDLGRVAEAREAYARRAALGGWDEEVFIAQLERAKLSVAARAPHEQVVAEHLGAFSARPWRVEPLLHLARYCRQAGRFTEGYIYSKAGLSTPKPPSDILFVEHAAYDWQLLDEFSICAYWIGHWNESRSACESLLSGNSLPHSERARVLKNLEFAREKLFLT